MGKNEPSRRQSRERRGTSIFGHSGATACPLDIFRGNLDPTVIPLYIYPTVKCAVDSNQACFTRIPRVDLSARNSRRLRFCGGFEEHWHWYSAFIVLEYET